MRYGDRARIRHIAVELDSFSAQSTMPREEGPIQLACDVRLFFPGLETLTFIGRDIGKTLTRRVNPANGFTYETSEERRKTIIRLLDPVWESLLGSHDREKQAMFHTDAQQFEMMVWDNEWILPGIRYMDYERVNSKA